MKTNFCKKANENKKSELVVMSNDELRSVQGGGGIVMIRHADGSVEIIFTRG